MECKSSWFGGRDVDGDFTVLAGDPAVAVFLSGGGVPNMIGANG